jgi:peroxiredoxin
MSRIDLLKKGDNLPNLNFSEALGNEIWLGDFRDRHNLVLLLTHPIGCAACEEKLWELNAALDRLRSEDAEVVAVVPGSPDQVRELQRRLALAFPVLIDAGATSALAATLLVADRFGEVFAVARTDERHHLPSMTQLVEELAFIELQCPE